MPYLSHHHVLTEEQVGQGMEEEEKGNEERGVWAVPFPIPSIPFPSFLLPFMFTSPSFGFWSYIGEVTWRRKVKGKGKWKKRNVHHPSSPFTSRWLRVEDVMWERDRPFPSLSCPSSQFLSPLRLASWIGNCKDKGSERERGEERDQLSPPIHLFLRSSPFLLSVMIAYVRAKRLDVRTLPSPTLYSPASQLGACVCSLAKPFNSLSS